MLVFVCNTQGDSFKKPDTKTVSQLIFPVSAHGLEFGEGRLFREHRVTEARAKDEDQGTDYPNEQHFREQLAHREPFRTGHFIGALTLPGFLRVERNRQHFSTPGFRANISAPGNVADLTAHSQWNFPQGRFNDAIAAYEDLARP